MYITHANSIIESIKNNKGFELYISKKSSKTKEIESLAKTQNVKIIRISMNELNKILKNTNHRGFALKLKLEKNKNVKTQTKDFEELLETFKKKENVFILLLDEIEDPQNFGAILRTAEQFSIDLVVTTQKRSAKDNLTVLRTSSGASQYVKKITVTNINNTINFLKKHDFWIYTGDVKGQDINKIKINNKKVALVLGNEGKGVHKLIKENSDFLIRIPTSGKIDSLNVSVSTGILIFEIKRQLNML
ncbi:23S rRNA (guanosine(2251)-2'-O)-methyltransferase RlmB [Borreliella turdi]|uniref:23S rRNA (guanosine(2251)-2'-O)-methyltransferase RlmB n=1 Tax=Borreliella turdi TaxID=57863 RepID=UPI0026487A2E|nr:23S rRNA (guanosine(2251)-2'-O)-methyltransferase RlmB [Borreliella turdi]WKC78066.1 23S rRNA (guanosine(2251)-2'-O)-methyltransferase RlmB [Borreliella turdi]